MVLPESCIMEEISRFAWFPLLSKTVTVYLNNLLGVVNISGDGEDSAIHMPYGEDHVCPVHRTTQPCT